MDKMLLERIWNGYQNSDSLPSPQSITKFLEKLLGLIFPQLNEEKFNSIYELKEYSQKVESDLLKILRNLEHSEGPQPEAVLEHFNKELSRVHSTLLMDAQAIVKGDPAAENVDEVIRSYPGFYAIAVYRIAHIFYTMGIPYLPRILTEHAHEKTGIDINPGAKIGEGFCIDHGTGVVIGETAVIGSNVKIYQGVTLGALSVNKEMAKSKRHPTIEDNVVIYSGATILGGNTVVGEYSIIGGNVWLIKSVPPHSRVYHRSQIDISNAELKEGYSNQIPDPSAVLMKKIG
jgi:serine O-acetyltransferase